MATVQQSDSRKSKKVDEASSIVDDNEEIIEKEIESSNDQNENIPNDNSKNMESIKDQQKAPITNINKNPFKSVKESELNIDKATIKKSKESNDETQQNPSTESNTTNLLLDDEKLDETFTTKKNSDQNINDYETGNDDSVIDKDIDNTQTPKKSMIMINDQIKTKETNENETKPDDTLDNENKIKTKMLHYDDKVYKELENKYSSRGAEVYKKMIRGFNHYIDATIEARIKKTRIKEQEVKIKMLNL